MSELSDQAAPEQEHASHEDHALNHRNPLAEAGEILVSRTVKDLVAGSGLHFKERGKHSLKGLQEPMELYAALH